MRTPKIIAVVGPTASGKTSLGIMLSKRFGGEVISVDSRQVYTGMDIGTAKPKGEWRRIETAPPDSVSTAEPDGREIRITPEEGPKTIGDLFGETKALYVDDVPHWGINISDPDTLLGAAEFKAYAEKTIRQIHRRGHVPILVGGTGLWMQAVVDNFNLSTADADPELRAELEQRSIDDLFAEYKQLDPKGAQVIDRQNKRRLVRALEVTKRTGKPFSDQKWAGQSKYEALQIGLHVSREQLYERIDDRVEEMIARGFVNEVRALRDRYGCDIESMSAIGYRQICAFLRGDQSLSEAIDDVKTASRQYAKRQLTWFKRDERIQWVNAPDEALPIVERFLKKG